MLLEVHALDEVGQDAMPPVHNFVQLRVPAKRSTAIEVRDAKALLCKSRAVGGFLGQVAVIATV